MSFSVAQPTRLRSKTRLSNTMAQGSDLVIVSLSTQKKIGHDQYEDVDTR